MLDYTGFRRARVPRTGGRRRTAAFRLSFAPMNTADASRRAWFATACLVLSIGIGGPFSAPAQQSAERPLVIDFYALGPDGVSIADLKAEELTIKLDGRTRTIRS